MRSLRPFATILFCFVALSPCAQAEEALEARIREIERLSLSAPRQESEAAIAALRARQGELTPEQRDRVEYVRLRNLALADEFDRAVQGFKVLLGKKLPADFRIQMLITAITTASSLEDWPLAFNWLNDALSHLPEAPADSAVVYGAASHIYTTIGEPELARNYGLRSVDAARSPRELCRGMGSIALVEEYAGNVASAEAWRRRQIDACLHADDALFVANARYGVGKMAARRGDYEEALRFSEESLAEFETLGYTAGARGTELVIANSLLALKRNLDRAEQLATGAAAYYRHNAWSLAAAEAEDLLSRLAEARGDRGAALTYLRASMRSSAKAEEEMRKRRISFLQVQFDTRFKEQQIRLLEAEKALADARAAAEQRRQFMLAVGVTALLLIAALLALSLRRATRDRHRYRQRAQRDSLTGLYNYQQSRMLGEKALARARGAQRPFTVAVIDIDLFKQVNDRYGHVAGDVALRSLGKWITLAVGDEGLAARVGGDEFMILLEHDAEEMDRVLGRVRANIEPITVFDRTFRINISAGVCLPTSALHA